MGKGLEEWNVGMMEWWNSGMMEGWGKSGILK
jgi:hypothetical protein